MKVLYIIDTLKGYGAEKSVVQIAINLKETTPVFIQLYKGNSFADLLDENAIKVYPLNLGKGTREGLDRIIPIIDSEKPDIIHSTLFRSDRFARKLKKIFPSIILVGSFVNNSYSRKRFNQLSFISKLKLRSTLIRDRLSARHVDYFISNSHAIMDSNIKALAVNREIVEVIYRGRSFENRIPSIEAIKQIKKNLNIDEEKTIILNVARLSYSKGQIDLVKAFQIIAKTNPNILLLLAGEGIIYKELKELIANFNLEKRIFLLGYRKDVPALLEMADFFVYPSYFEGLSGSLTEAIISKTPIIISDIPENLECFPENTYLNFELGNMEDLALKMEEALKIEDWNHKTMLAYIYAKQNFDINKVSRRYDDFYQKILFQSKFRS